LSEHLGLPQGWTTRPISNVVAPTRPRVSPANCKHLAFIGMEHVEANTMHILGTVPAETMKSSAVHFQPGDVLYGRLRPYLNKVVRPDFEGLCSAEFIVFPEAGIVSNAYLQYRLNSADFVAFASHLIDGDRPRVDFSGIGGFEIEVPPALEQRRIVAKLDELLTLLDASVAALKRVQACLKRYRASVLKAAAGGKLTEAWRAEHPAVETGAALLQRIVRERRTFLGAAETAKLPTSHRRPRAMQLAAGYPMTADNSVGLPVPPESWCLARVADLGDVQLGRQRSPEHHSGEWMRPYLRVANVFEDRIDTSDVKSMNFTPVEFETYQLRDGDVLLNEGQSLELVGRPAIYRDQVPGACFQNTLVRFRPYNGLTPEFALIVFRAYLWNGRFQRIARWTTNIAHLGASRFSQLEFPLPPVSEQAQIVIEVERCLSEALQTEQIIEMSLKRAQRLRQSVLKQAFGGKLVQQDPNDEPANVLLERIRLARGTEPQMSRKSQISEMRSRTARRSGTSTPKQLSLPLEALSTMSPNGGTSRADSDVGFGGTAERRPGA
jgi:type I restriction enzyme S subunit